MNEAQRIIQVFVRLLKERNPAFNAAAWQALPQLDRSLAELETNDDHSVAEIITNWAKSYPDLIEVIRITRANIVEDEDEKINTPSGRENAQIIDNKFMVRETIKSTSQQQPPTRKKPPQSHD